MAARKLIFVLVAYVAALAASAGAQDYGTAIADISGYSVEQLQAMQDARLNAPSIGALFVSGRILNRAVEYQEMLENQGNKAVAEQLLAAYETDQASRDFAAVAFALQRNCGYASHRMRSNDRGAVRKLGDNGDPDQDKLAEQTLALVDAIAATDHKHAESAAVEVLLQVMAECLPSGHLEADNGHRTPPTMPPALCERAADFLDSEDPFVRAMADWTIAIKVGIDNEGKGNGEAWPGENPPEWCTKWMAVPVSDHLAFDYVRQAISLADHRRGADLQKLAADVARRAEEKAAWATAIYGDENPALGRMQAAYGQLEQSIRAGDLTSQRTAWVEWRKTVRPVVLGSGDVDFDSLVYLKRFSGGHHIQPTIHDNKFPPGGDIFVQKGLDPSAPATPLIQDQLPHGYVQDIDLWFDADKVVFSRTDGPSRGNDQQIYEIGIDGSGLRTLVTSGHQDVDPAYLPDGSVIFGSTRAEAGIMCLNAGSHHTNIYRLLADGETIWRLSYCKDDDAYPHVLNDGRIMYMRWDYQERSVDEIFSLWTARPDGSGTDGFYRVHIPDNLIIQALKDPKPIPGSDMLVAAGSSHRAGDEGMVALCDVAAGINNPRGIRTVTPYHSPIGRGIGSEMRPVEEGGVPYIGGYYAKPWGLTEKTFLTSAGFDMPISASFHAYYIDVWGNKELLHRDKLMETMSVIPLRPRFKPPIIPDARDPEKTYATCYVQDVYRDLPGVERGEVKYIRILEQMFWPYGAEFTGTYRRPGGTGQGAVRIIGIAPVAEDGSAAFEVPSDAPLYFQALDEHYRGVQRMRTHVEFAPGEIRGCIGCHETRGEGMNPAQMGAAMEKDPVRPTPPHWGASTFIDYEEMIQPIFEEKCVKCHKGDNPKGGLLLTAEKGDRGYMQSYRSLFGLEPGQSFPKKGFGRRDGPDNEAFRAMRNKVVFILKETDGQVTQPKQFGSPVAPLGKKLAEDAKHRKMLTDDEMRLLMAWLDVRAPYHSHYNRRRQRVELVPFDPFGENREHQIVDIN